MNDINYDDDDTRREEDPFVTELSEKVLMQALGLLQTNWQHVNPDTIPPYSDEKPVRERLLLAELDETDLFYLAALGHAINPEASRLDGNDLTRLCEILVSVPDTGLTTELVDCTFGLLPPASRFDLSWYQSPGVHHVLQVLYLLMLRSEFFSHNFDRRLGPVNPQIMGVDPVNVPEQNDETFRLREREIKRVHSIQDDDHTLWHNLLLVLPPLLDVDVKDFLEHYARWVDDRLAEQYGAGGDEDW